MPSLDDIERRRFLQIMAASAALASGACSGPPPENIEPYVRTPPELRDSTPLYYATAFVLGGYAHGVLVETHSGRATKVEGNPSHPASLGATSPHVQASVLQLWDPDRSRAVHRGRALSTWREYDAAIEARRGHFERNGGASLRVLTGTVTSPTLAAQLKALLARYPNARWHAHDPLADENASAGAHLAFGRPVDSVLALDKARVVLALDADFMSEGPASVRYAHDFMQARRKTSRERYSRLYAIETTPGLAGALADERLALALHDIEALIWRVAGTLGAAPRDVFAADARLARWEAALVRALGGARGESLVIAGPRLTRETRALVHRLNHVLGNTGRSIHHIEPVAVEAAPLGELVADMNAGRVDTLLVLGANPVYDAPVDLGFAQALARVPLSVHSGLYRDETARAASWHVPQPHTYEQWSDARAFDGTASIVQPVMRPLYDTRPALELLARFMARPADAAALVRRTWSSAAWRDSLREGVVAGSASAPLAVTPAAAIAPPRLARAPLVAVFTPDPATRDGELANNAWLQELPRPLTQLVWDNAALMSAATARALDCANGSIVRVEQGGRFVEAPVWICAGHADGVVTLPLGYGRTAAGVVGNGVGFDAYRLRTAAALATPLAVAVQKTGRARVLATTQGHFSMEGREPVRAATLEDYLKNPGFARDAPRKRVPEESLYPPHEYRDYRWGMAIDLNACIGCSACTIACQAENNIPVVGREQVMRGREMHWIRVDRYQQAERTHFQPVPCMHCENAPCEEVCPVGATVHDSDGLNLQVYNRCIGTRFCSQNCPYKVRRFNFLQYSDTTTRELKAQGNPQVTVRSRGVMEKCTYCIQRITRARIEADKAGRRLRDGEVVTACQAVCPTRAIVFGDLNDRESAVSRAKASPRDYTLLADLNTRPRTTYLARVINEDPEV
ncbi:MAG TPA: 4Fe-4S dicluster domain-containing protein [Burkholderiales bacterium]|nr:4Fe-4S dicluster domain-containing protein [Burkholderiales bacterium]